MGVLDPMCISEAEGIIYVSAKASTYLGDTKQYDDIHYVLVKSNPYPASNYDIKWTFVSSVPRKVLYDLNSFKVTCEALPNGIITIIARESSVESTSRFEEKVRGIQYSPDLSLNSNATGKGGWRNIDVDDGYVWVKNLWIYAALTKLTTSTGTVLVHSLLDYSTTTS